MKYSNYSPKPKSGIAVDGACSGNPGPAEYKIVNIGTGEVVKIESIGIGTNNHAEFIGLCDAIQLFPDQVIYSDSLTAISWVKKKKHGSKHFHPYMDWCIDMLKELKHTPQINHWNTKAHGEIPADFGNKKL